MTNVRLRALALRMGEGECSLDAVRVCERVSGLKLKHGLHAISLLYRCALRPHAARICRSSCSISSTPHFQARHAPRLYDLIGSFSAGPALHPRGILHKHSTTGDACACCNTCSSKSESIIVVDNIWNPPNATLLSTPRQTNDAQRSRSLPCSLHGTFCATRAELQSSRAARRR